MKTPRLTDSIGAAEVFSETAQRLIRWGATEAQAYTLARVIKLDRRATDATVEDTVVTALVGAKEAVSGKSEVEYLGGVRRDTLRLEGR